MRRKPGGPGGRGRTWTPTGDPCPVCKDHKRVEVITDDSDVLTTVRCPHCGPPYLAVTTYYRQEK